MGDLLRHEIHEKTEIGLKIEKIIDDGDLVPDEVTFSLLKNRIKKEDCKRGFILDGFPRDFEQAEFVAKNFDINCVLVFDLSDSEGIKRIGGRRTCEDCGEVYHVDYKKPKTVLVAIKNGFSADEYADMIEFILAGASLVGMHETSIYAKNSKRYPGTGAILKMLEFATSASYSVVGKPSKLFYEAALSALKKQAPRASFENVTMISDDVTGDLVGAKEMGMRTIFVTSGKYKTQEEILPSLEESKKPDLVYANMQGILEQL